MPPPEEDIVIGGEEPATEAPPARRRGRPRKVGRKSVKKRAPAKKAPAAKKATVTKKRAPAKRAPAAKKTTRRRAVKKLVPHAVNVATQTYEDGRVGVVVGKDGFDLGHFTLSPGVGTTSQHFVYYDKV